jgi:phosphatidylglycerophosphate synthase
MRRIINLSNALTLFRLVSAPIIMFLIIFDRMDFALILFILAALSDFLDGYLSRRLKKETKIGSVLDKAADKLLMGFVVLGFIIKFDVLWLLLIIIPIVVFYIIGSYYFFKHKYKVTLFGKISIWLQAITVVAFMIDYQYKFYLFWIVIAITAYVSFSYVYRILIKAYKK